MGESNSVRRLLTAYYDLLSGGIQAFDAERMTALLHPELAFAGPIAGNRAGAAGFVRGVSGFIETVSSLAMLQQVYSESSAATLYDAEMPGGPVRFAEFFEVRDGRIESLRLVYDAALYVKRGGR
jgi:hypothetical protein